MSRPWIFGIVCVGLLVSSMSIGWAQEESSSKGISLSDRLTLLKDKFRREQPQTKSTQRSRQQSSRNRSNNKMAGRSQRDRRSSAAQSTDLPVAAKSKYGAQASDLLPVDVFARKSSKSKPQPKVQTKQLEPWELNRAASVPRAGSKQSRPVAQKLARKSPSTKQIARRSPPTSRANELNDALADLLQDTDAIQSPQHDVEQRQQVEFDNPKTPTAPMVVKNNIFDLRQALLDDDAETADEAKTDEVVVKSQAELEAQAAAAKQYLGEVVAKQEVPSVVASQEINFAEQASEAIQPEAIVEPIVVPSPVVSKPTPAPNFSAPVAVQQKTIAASDSAAKRVFAAPQGTINPMRSFLPTPEKVEPVKQVVSPKRGLLQTSHQPVIVSRVEGPRSILVGQEATYQVTLENTSNTQASDLSAEISVPEWAELVDAMSTSGVVERISQGMNEGALEWKLRDLAPRSSQALRIRLIPRSGRPLQLGVRWSQAPTQSQAMVEVQEPKLEIAISGPQEVRFGKPQRYRLTLRNPGTGTTEKVSVRLVPPGGKAKDATTQLIGDLKPGETKDLDLELTAREAGELLIQANAFAEGGLKAEMNKKVLCRKPELEVDWRGPDKKYAGTVAAYYFRVNNPGTAVTEPVDVNLKLPAGAEFVSASEGYAINSATGVLSWRLGAIGVGEEQFIQMRCKIAKPGLNNFQILASTNGGELSASKNFQTEVEALADLKLEVTDPQGPLPMGETVVYQIRVSNRGTTDAEGISIVGLFSEGIDPMTVEGAQFSVRDGRVSFHPIKSLPAGRDVLLRIHAKASQVGTHIFRAEVACPKLDIKLAAEETTRFFEDEHRWEDGETPYSAERKASLAR